MSNIEPVRAALQRFCDATACVPLPGQPVTTTMIQTLGMALSEANAVLAQLPAEPKDQTEWDRVYGLLRHWSQRAQAAEAAIVELDDANNAYAKFVSSDGIEAHRQNRERLIAAWNAARKAAGRDEYSFPLRAAT